jgi:multidrug efflux pump subunit AcrB
MVFSLRNGRFRCASGICSNFAYYARAGNELRLPMQNVFGDVRPQFAEDVGEGIAADGPTIPSFEYMDRVRQQIASQYPELRTFVSSGSMVDGVLNMGAPAPIDVQVSSPDLDQAYNSARDIAGRIRKLSGVSEVYIPQDMDYPAVRLDVDRVHAAELGLSPQDVVRNVVTALDSNLMIAPNYWLDRKTGNDYFLTVQYYENGHPSVHDFVDLKGIPLRGVNVNKATTLDTVARLTKILTPTEVDHYQIVFVYRVVGDGY